MEELLKLVMSVQVRRLKCFLWIYMKIMLSQIIKQLKNMMKLILKDLFKCIKGKRSQASLLLIVSYI